MEIIDNIPVGRAGRRRRAPQIKTCYHICGQAAMMADHHRGTVCRSAALLRTRR